MPDHQEWIDAQVLSDDEGMCACGKETWEMCDCGDFFLNWVCGFNPETGQCSMAGSEDCDWECPRARTALEANHG